MSKSAFAIAVAPSAVAEKQWVAPTTTQKPYFDQRLSWAQVRDVSPPLEQITQQRLFGAVLRRPGLSPGDRSPVAVAALKRCGVLENGAVHLRPTFARV